MKDAIILDIETAPGDNLPDAPEAILMKGVRADFKPDTVERKREENKKAWAEKAALDWRVGRVIAFGIILPDDDKPLIWLHGNGDADGVGIVSGTGVSFKRNESRLLASLWKNLNGFAVAGFNIRSFDLPYLVGRSAVCGVKPSRTFKLAKYRMDLGVIDWLEILSNWELSRTLGWNLGYYANVFGLKHQPLGDGSEVPKRWADGDYDYVIEHLREDLLTTRELHDRFAPAFL